MNRPGKPALPAVEARGRPAAIDPMRSFCLAVAAAFLATPCAFARSPQEVFRATEQSVFALEVLDDKGQVIAAFSALALEKGRAVTQCDLLEGGSAFRLVHRGGKILVTVDKRDGDRHLCLLAGAGLNLSAVQLAADKLPTVGASVYAVSNALGLGTSITEGVVSGVREYKADTFIQFTAPIAPGSEGGGLFDSDGRLVGMIVYRPRDGQNVNFALPARWLTEIDRRSASAASVPAWSGKLLAYERDKNWADMAEHARRWAAASPDSVDPWIWCGYAELRRGDPHAAELAYREALKRDPGSIPAALGVAGSLIAQGHAQAALDVLRPLLAVRAEDGRVWTLIGTAERLLGHMDVAQDAYEKAVRFEPWNQDAQLGLGDVALARNDWRTQVSILRLLTQIEPQNYRYWIALSEAYVRINRPARALNSAERALSINPQSADALLWKGIALAAAKRRKEAIETLNMSLQGNPVYPLLAWNALGQTYYGLKLYPEAIAAYREALKLAPEDRSVRGGLGVALKDGGYFTEALALFEKLKSESPEDAFSWCQIGYVYGHLVQPDKAIPAYERSLAINPQQAKVWYALMEAYNEAGRRDDVKRAYDKLSSLDRNMADAAYRRFILPYEVTR